jgi:hypothetical protein
VCVMVGAGDGERRLQRVTALTAVVAVLCAGMTETGGGDRRRF